MNNQKGENLEQESTITVIPLSTSHIHAPYISDQLLSLIQKEKKEGKKTLLFYSRRGNSRAWICQDCGYFERCPNCDIALAYHSDPTKRLVCHQCGYVSLYHVTCPNCHGAHFASVGVGIQRIESDLRSLLSGDIHITRIDSDTYKNPISMEKQIQETDVVLSTSLAHFLQHSQIGAIVFICFEVNLSVPEYDFEEQLFDEIAYFKKQKLPLYIQTYIPEHPLLEIITEGNYQSFLSYIMEERRHFGYPPFSEFLTLRIHDEKKERVSDMLARLVNKISLLKRESTFLAFDSDIWERYAGEWVQKIVLRDKELGYIVNQLETEIVRNRSVTLERG